MSLDIAIVGAGISGLSAARQVLLENPMVQIGIFDKSANAGGRVKSLDLGGDFGVVELGAGRFSPADHHRLNRHVERYQIKTKPFEFTLSPLQSSLHEQSREFLVDMCAALRELYVATDIRKRHAISLKDAAVDMFGIAKFELLVDMCGYDTLFHPGLNFEEGFNLLRHHPETSSLFLEPSPLWRSVDGGLIKLIDALKRDIQDHADYQNDHELVEVCLGDGEIGHNLVFETSAGQRVVRARKVLFAMPIWGVHQIKGLGISNAIRDRIQSVPLIKAYFAYSERWWDGMDVAGKCFSTATAFRKVYFPQDGNHLWIYCDGQSAEGLHEQFINDPDLHTSFVSAIRDALPFATKSENIPKPIKQGHEFWSHGISFWRSGLNLFSGPFWQIGPDAIVCSDIFSQNLGWIEGSLESAEKAASSLLTSSTTLRAQKASDESALQGVPT